MQRFTTVCRVQHVHVLAASTFWQLHAHACRRGGSRIPSAQICSGSSSSRTAQCRHVTACTVPAAAAYTSHEQLCAHCAACVSVPAGRSVSSPLVMGITGSHAVLEGSTSCAGSRRLVMFMLFVQCHVQVICALQYVIFTSITVASPIADRQPNCNGMSVALRRHMPECSCKV
jgi:hypothetical protein